MNKEQFIDLVNSWSDIEKTIHEYTANCTDEERVFMLNKYTENRNNTNTLLVKYITQDIPRGFKIAENLGEIVDTLVNVFWEFVVGENTVYYYVYNKDNEEEQYQIEVDTADKLYDCFETSKLTLW